MGYVQTVCWVNHHQQQGPEYEYSGIKMQQSQSLQTNELINKTRNLSNPSGN